jgi:hypothetical protein
MLRDKIIEYLQKDRKRSIEIPELEETIYFTPVTVLEMEKIMTLSGGGASSKDFHVQTIIEKAEDAEGKKVFSIEDKSYLEKMDWAIIVRISNEIQKIASFEDTKKNSLIPPS